MFYNKDGFFQPSHYSATLVSAWAVEIGPRLRPAHHMAECPAMRSPPVPPTDQVLQVFWVLLVSGIFGIIRKFTLELGIRNREERPNYWCSYMPIIRLTGVLSIGKTQEPEGTLTVQYIYCIDLVPMFLMALPLGITSGRNRIFPHMKHLVSLPSITAIYQFFSNENGLRQELQRHSRGIW